MELKSFSVKNFRSITDAHKIKFENYSVLIGKNNEGKSNLLNALSICMRIMQNSKMVRRMLLRDNKRYYKESLYDWDRDFPINLQSRKNGLKTIFQIEFKFTDEELKGLNKIIKTRLNNNDVNLKIEIDKNNEIDIKCLKRGTKALNEKSLEVMDFISKKITYNYIPAIRQEIDTIRIIENSIANEFGDMNEIEEYKNAMNTIKKLQSDKMNKISQEVKNALVEFIPKIKDVKINFENDFNYNRIMLRDLNILIDDGNLTNIEQKGDGIKSLIALAMLKNRTNDKKISIIAIDEPEAHLHAGAITELSKTLKSLSGNNQVMICTHNPIFMDKDDIKNNIVISNGKAKPAKNVQEIRELLGIKMSDNLINAENILLVEGPTDKNILTSIIKNKSKKLKKSLEDGYFNIIDIGGASKLSYNLNLYNSKFVNCFVFFDSDKAGVESVAKEIEDSIITQKNIYLCKCVGMKESEIEDCLNSQIYENYLNEEYGVNINIKEFKNSKKWSDRIHECFDKQGKIYNNKIENIIKTYISNEFCNKYNDGNLIKEKSEVIEKMISELESII